MTDLTEQLKRFGETVADFVERTANRCERSDIPADPVPASDHASLW